MPLLQLIDVQKLYKMGESSVRALDNVSLSIERGEYIAIMGPSGSGKSTLMNVLGFLDVPDGGKYLFDGQNTTGFSEAELAFTRNKSVGFIFQSFNLLPRESADENVQLPMIYAGIPKSERKVRAEKLLEKVKLEHRGHHKPNELSGGERQRVAIARALVNDPEIILADEPTGNLDSKTGKEIMQLLDELNAQGKTVILVTHDTEISKYAKRVITIRDGKIISDQITR